MPAAGAVSGVAVQRAEHRDRVVVEVRDVDRVIIWTNGERLGRGAYGDGGQD